MPAANQLLVNEDSDAVPLRSFFLLPFGQRFQADIQSLSLPVGKHLANGLQVIQIEDSYLFRLGSQLVDLLLKLLSIQILH